MNSTTTICLTAEDRAFLHACGIAQDAPWVLHASDPLEIAVNEALRKEDESWNSHEAAE